MTQHKRRLLESTVAALQQRYGTQSVRRAAEIDPPPKPQPIATGFAALDAITGCDGLPLGAITLLSGAATSGIVTLAYKALLHAQQGAKSKHRYTVAILDLADTYDADYVARCGVNLDHLLVVRPPIQPTTVDLLIDLVKTRELRAIVIDSLPDLVRQPATARHLHAQLPALLQILRPISCALIFIDETAAPWRRLLNLDPSWQVRHHASLCIELRRERWLVKAEELVGYRAQAHVLKSAWLRSHQSAPIDIVFNGVIKAGKAGEL